jgi:isoquinoline 1-oxidoreductase beta subunit
MRAMPNLKRRHFILGTAGVAGALVVGWAALPARQRLVPDAPLPATDGQYVLNGWVKVSDDGTITVVMAQVEMGQGAQTGLAMLLADEMDADWSSVKLEPSTFDRIYNNQAAIVDSLPFRPDDRGVVKRVSGHLARRILREVPGMQGTGGSSSIADQWLPMREAGAAARAMLVAAAASRWQVPANSCTVAHGVVQHPSGRRASFGELAAAAASLPVPENVKLKSPADFRLIGQPVRRLDNAPKLDGSARYGIDAAPPGLLYASVIMCPTLGGRVEHFDARAANALRGVRHVVALDPVPGGIGSTGATSGGVAVIADTPYHAIRALEHIVIEWDHGTAHTQSSLAIGDALTRALDSADGKTHFEMGDVKAAMASSRRTISAEYRVPLLAHAAMEPMNCTVQFKDGRATVWAGTQAQGFARAAAAKALGIDADRVDLRVPFLGGGFGRRYFSDVIVQAAHLARLTDGAPVQLIWTREQDMTHDYYRPAYLSRCSAGFDAAGRLIAWHVTSAGSSMGAPSFLDNATEGAFDTAYAFPNARVAHQTVEPGIPLGIWRSVGHSQNGFFTESFIDECAAAAQRDPVAFRADLLRGDERHLRVLRRVAELSQWGTPLTAAADGAPRARGIAIHRCFGSIVAQVAEVSLAPDRQIRVHRVVCVVDCGLPVNPNLIRQQMEGAIVFGLSAALYGEITVENGKVQQQNFDGYAPVRMDACPQIDVDIVPSALPPGGVGEPGTPPVAPAVANALFALTGQRLRSLPLRLA